MDFESIKRHLRNEIKQQEDEVKKLQDAKRRLEKGLTLSELLKNYRRQYCDNYSIYYNPQYQEKIRIAKAQGYPVDVDDRFERSETLYASLAELNNKAKDPKFKFKYLIPGEKRAKVWTSNKTNKND